ncbi:GNAT family protein [Gottschalkiaceae bacterium SANA]|nr:GNAT family protein [Gottschalkiaceae bacterium SANA]
MYVEPLTTKRLLLIPMSHEQVRSVIIGEEIPHLGTSIEKDPHWPRKDTLDILPVADQILESQEHPSGFEIWMIVKRDTQTVIGDIGFQGPPDSSGTVEIGYGLVESKQSQGFGSEALQALIQWALQQPEVKSIRATCLLVNQPSRKILEKNQMKEIKRNDKTISYERKKK